MTDLSAPGFVVAAEHDSNTLATAVVASFLVGEYRDADEACDAAVAYATERTLQEVRRDGPYTYRAYVLTPID